MDSYNETNLYANVQIAIILWEYVNTFFDFTGLPP